MWLSHCSRANVCMCVAVCEYVWLLQYTREPPINIYTQFIHSTRHTPPGEDYKQFRIGQTCTVFGTVKMSVAYRTKMTISPTQTGRDAKIMLKSDHFLNEHRHGDTPHRNYYNTRNK